MSNLVVTVRDQGIAIHGWTAARVTRSIESCTGSFTLEMTERYEKEVDESTLVAGVAVEISIEESGDVLLTGFVDSIEYIITPREHKVVVSGRGVCADLIDCSGETDRILANTRIDDLCSILTAKFTHIKGIVVSDPLQEQIGSLPPIPFQLVSITETVWEIIERCARYSGVLAYENEEGALTLALAGDEIGASGFELGKNVESAVVVKSVLGRFSNLAAVLTNYNNMTDIGVNLKPQYEAPDPQIVALGRYRPRYIISEQPASDRTYLQRRVDWQVARAYGQSRQIRILTDTWLDADDVPWQLNVLVPVSMPLLKVPKGTMLLIAETTFILDEHGTHAEIMLAPREAYLPEPLVIQRIDPDIAPYGSTRT